MLVPNYIIHYFHAERSPLMNLSDLSDDKRNQTILALNRAFEAGKTKRYFPDWYMPQRLEAETRMRKRFLEKGGKPKRTAPHYFTLGNSALFAGQYFEQTRELILPIDRFDKTELCFCLNDSLWTMSKSHDSKQVFTNRWFEGDVFSYSETVEILQQLQLDVEHPESLAKNKTAFVEALVWCDINEEST